MELKDEIRDEREYTYVVDSGDVEDLVQEIVSSSRISLDGIPYILEKGKKEASFYLLCSDEYKVTRAQNGTRYRFKVDLKSGNIKYTEKIFDDGLRYEKNEKMKNDYTQAYTRVPNMPDVDTVMVKYSLKYEYSNYLNNRRFQVVIDCCYAISPDNIEQRSEPFYYIEFEEKNGRILESIVETDFFVNKLKKYLKDVPYSSHNRIKMCKESYPDKILGIKDEKQLKKYLKDIRKLYKDQEKQLNIFNNIEGTCTRGEKETERSVGVESELKLAGQDTPNNVLSIVRNNLDEDYMLVKAEPRIIVDIYMDNKNDTLYKNDASFRIRQRKKKDGWIVGFKSTHKSDVVLERKKIRTALTIKEILKYKEGSLVGFAAENAYDFLDELDEDKVIRPKVLVIECRDRYVVRPFVQNEEDNGDFEIISDNHFDMKRKELLHVIFDYVTAYDLYDMTEEEIDFIIKYGEVDTTKKNHKMTTFFTAEIEPNTRVDVKYVAQELFHKVCHDIENSDIELLSKSKYTLSKERLDSANN